MDPVSKAQSQAENNPISRLKGHQGSRWQKGRSGNPGGRPKKLEITRIFERILRSPKNRREIEKIVMDILRAKRMMSVLLLREMAERTEGKVTEHVEMNVSGKIELAMLIEERRKKRAEGITHELRKAG